MKKLSTFASADRNPYYKWITIYGNWSGELTIEIDWEREKQRTENLRANKYKLEFITFDTSNEG